MHIGKEFCNVRKLTIWTALFVVAEFFLVVRSFAIFEPSIRYTVVTMFAWVDLLTYPVAVSVSFSTGDTACSPWSPIQIVIYIENITFYNF